MEAAADLQTVVIFENDPRQAEAYRQLFTDQGYVAERALPSDDVQALCGRVKPGVVVFDMAFWEADTAYVFGVLNNAVGFERPLIVALSTLPVQSRRAKRFGADAVWVRGIDDAAQLPRLAGDLLRARQEGKLKPRQPTTPL
jgi:DNA-binding response OmpR family regulator